VEFLDNGECIRFEAIDAWLSKLRAILSWFEHQTSFHFYSSSVLLIYDAKGSGSVSHLLLLLLLALGAAVKSAYRATTQHFTKLYM
jgi:hypothetical protein